jgi:hypothetical protein
MRSTLLSLFLVISLRGDLACRNRHFEVKVATEAQTRADHSIAISVRVTNASDAPIFLPGSSEGRGSTVHTLFVEQRLKSRQWRFVGPFWHLPPIGVIKLQAGESIVSLVRLTDPYRTDHEQVAISGTHRITIRYFLREKDARPRLGGKPAKAFVAHSYSFEVSPP